MTVRIRSGATVVALLAALIALLAGGGQTSRAAFSGSILNTKNSVSVAVAAPATCRAAMLADEPTRMYTLADDKDGVVNLGSLGASAVATVTGIEALPLHPKFPVGGGCRHDPLTYADLSPAVARLAARWVSTAGTMTISSSRTITQETWVRATTKGLIMGFSNNTGLLGSNKTELEVSLTPSGQIDFTSGGKHLTTPAGSTYADGAWHHVVAVYDQGAKWLYVDGQLRAQGSSQPSTSVTGASWYLGHTPDTLGLLSSYLTGGVQFAATYDKALTSAQVKEHYQAGAAQ